MNKNKLEQLLNLSLDTGADFSEIYYEDTINRTIQLSDRQIDKIGTHLDRGVGIRIKKDDRMVYASTNDLSDENLANTINKLKESFQGEPIYKNVILKDKNIYNKEMDYHQGYTYKDKKNILKKIDSIARNHSSKVEQVEAILLEEKKDVVICNHLGEYSTDKRYLFRLIIYIYVNDHGKKESTYEAYGNNTGYNLFATFDLEKEVKRLVDIAISKLDSIDCPNGVMPVIIGPAFGAVILHESCGHPMEATAVSKNSSVLCGMLNKRVGSDQLTVIDDGTIEGAWGSTFIDDEGELTRKNVLIKNGILKSYLVDKMNEKPMHHPITGSGRRQNYLYPPTSRMNNTYIAKGTDKIEDMIKSINYGIYAKTMNGGSVDPNTGEFNFGCREAFLIENGKRTKIVKGATLMGNTIDVLKNIEMISDDLSLGTGYCGSDSGSIPVTCGEPTIKVNNILVGGNK